MTESDEHAAAAQMAETSREAMAVDKATRGRLPGMEKRAGQEQVESSAKP